MGTTMMVVFLELKVSFEFFFSYWKQYSDLHSITASCYNGTHDLVISQNLEQDYLAITAFCHNGTKKSLYQQLCNVTKKRFCEFFVFHYNGAIKALLFFSAFAFLLVLHDLFFICKHQTQGFSSCFLKQTNNEQSFFELCLSICPCFGSKHRWESFWKKQHNNQCFTE